MKAALSYLVLFFTLLTSLSASAQGLEGSVKKLGSEDYAVVTDGISELGASGSAQALSILEALEDRKLFVDTTGTVFLKKGGALLDPATGKPGTAQGKLDVRLVNNVVRRALGPALAQLRLASEDRDARLKAASELARNPVDEALEVMRKAASTEKDDAVLAELALGIAKLDLQSTDTERRLAAIQVIGDSGDLNLRSELERLVQKNPNGTYVEKDERVRNAAVLALSSISTKLAFTSAAANLFYGLSLGSVLLLAALGLAITFGLMRVINMAHGEMLMVGAYTTYVVQNLFQSYLPSAFDWYLLLAVPLAFGVCALLGAALERGVIRYLYGRPLETLLATWGLSLILIQTVRLLFGAQNVTVSNPSWLSGGWELAPTVVLPYSRIAVILFVVVVVSFVWALLQRTPLGLRVRAVTQNRETAAALGIPTRRVDMWTFAFGSGVAGLGGVALSQLGNVGPELGQQYIVDSFMVVVLGGVGNVVGTIVGAVGLGLANKFVEPMAGAVLGKIIILALIIVFIQKRPQGIFALKGRAEVQA